MFLLVVLLFAGFHIILFRFLVLVLQELFVFTSYIKLQMNLKETQQYPKVV